MKNKPESALIAAEFMKLVNKMDKLGIDPEYFSYVILTINHAYFKINWKPAMYKKLMKDLMKGTL